AGAALAEKSASACEAHLTSAVPSGPSGRPARRGKPFRVVKRLPRMGEAVSSREMGRPVRGKPLRPSNRSPRVGDAVARLEVASPARGKALHASNRPPPGCRAVGSRPAPGRPRRGGMLPATGEDDACWLATRGRRTTTPHRGEGGSDGTFEEEEWFGNAVADRRRGAVRDRKSVV